MTMLSYSVLLALRSLRKTPWITTIVVIALAFGVAIPMVSYCAHHSLIKRNLYEKHPHLYQVQLDSWHAQAPFVGPKNEMPTELSYRDAMALLKNTLAKQKAAFYLTGGTIALPESGNVKPHFIRAFATSYGFFDLFEKPFIFGKGWLEPADYEYQTVVVITDFLNNYLFNGENSVGRKLYFEGHTYTVIGIIKNSDPENTPESMGTGYSSTIQIFFPLGVVKNNKLWPWNRSDSKCPKDDNDYGEGFDRVLNDRCVFMNYWVKLPDPLSVKSYKEYVSLYVKQQIEMGFYARPENFSVLNINESFDNLRMDQSAWKFTYFFGLAFLCVCILNCNALMLSKFMRTTHESVIRRSLGASKFAIFIQYIVESFLVAALGGLFGVVLTYLGLLAMREIFYVPPDTIMLTAYHSASIFVLDTQAVIVLLITVLCASILSSLYPAVKACTSPIATLLK